MRLKRIISGITTAALAVSAFAGIGSARPEKMLSASAAVNNWKFDFGAAGTASGYTGVSASDSYSAAKGYGFSGSVENVVSNGTGAVSDAVKFTGGTFNVDLENGLYEIKVTIGNSPRTTIKIENMVQMMNLTGAGATETIQIPVTDGQLNVQAVEGMKGRDQTIAAMEITQINTTGEMRPTVWICGDSTVANYYNQADTAQHGWGQYLSNYINMNVFQVRNQATSGQYAKGFYEGGQFAPIEYYGKPGDYFIVSIGINDTNYSNGDEYYEVVTTMVKKAKAKGMNVILVKQQGRRNDLNRSPLLPGRWFGGQLDKIAAEQNVTIIDDFNAWQDFGLSIGGYDAMGEYYAVDDDLHQSAKGAQKNAELLAGLMKIGDTEMDTNAVYTFKNTNSGLVMDIEGGTMEEGTNVQQWGSNNLSCQQWQLQAFNGGTDYYYVRSVADPNYVLKAMTADNGGNIEIVPYSNKDSMMLFKFTKIGDGSYYISTRSSRDLRFVEVNAASKSSGANVQQWEYTYSKCQNWQAVTVTTTAAATTTETTTTTTVTETESTTKATETTSAETTATSPVLYGDANLDKKVTVADAVAILQHVALKDKYGLEGEALDNADVFSRGDGVTAMDALSIQKFDAKVISELPESWMIVPTTAAPIYESTTTAETTTATTTTTDPRYFAVDQTWEQGVKETVNAGYAKEDGYVNLDNVIGSNITFTVNAEDDGNYYVAIIMSNGKNDDRTMRIELNGDTVNYWKQPFLGTDNWTTWKETGIVLPLKAGANSIKFISETANGGPNLDYITITLTDEPYADTYDPAKESQIIESNKPTIYIAGDSTVQSYRADKAPQQGWGYYLQNYFSDDVKVENHAIAGRSSKSFYDEGRFNTIYENLKQGDYVLIQFAINDCDYTKESRYAPVCGDVDNPTEGSYEWYMTYFIKSAQEKGATPILVTTVIGLKAYSNGKFVNSYTANCDACKKLASKYNIPCIDLNTLMVNKYNSVGYDTAYKYHLMGVVEGSTDGTHFSEEGANVVASLVAGDIKNQKIEGLYTYVK